MRVLAVDQNTKTGFALGSPGGVPDLWTVDLRRDPTDSAEDIFGRAVGHYAAFFRDNAVDFVAIERVVPPSAAHGHTNAQTTMLTIGLYAILVGIVTRKEIRHRVVAASTWRVAFLGKGAGRLRSDAAKRLTMQTCRRLGWKPDGQDAADAGGIWSWACAEAAPYRVTTLRPGLFAEHERGQHADRIAT